MNRYLVVYDPRSGICELTNVGIFEADSIEEAEKIAQREFRTYRSLYVVNINTLPDGWSYYT